MSREVGPRMSSMSVTVSLGDVSVTGVISGDGWDPDAFCAMSQRCVEPPVWPH